MMELKRLSYKHKNSKFKYYIINYLRQLLPNSYFRKQKDRLLQGSLHSELQERVDYYNKLSESSALGPDAQRLGDLKLAKRYKTYFFDLYQYARYFNPDLKGHFYFGDVTDIPPYPGFTKSRPIKGQNQNSVLMKWNKIRHFLFIKDDPYSFEEKKDLLVSRGKIHPTQKHRIAFVERYFEHPLCDIGKVNSNELNPQWLVPRMTISEQLQYKFILCLEGNDVASNLKWVMSSNSLAVMPPPKFESWFMEGLLKPDVHYVALKEDCSDLEKKLNFYLTHPEKAQAIIENAHRFVAQFQDEEQEDLISLLVMDKYFQNTKQYR